MAQRLVPGVGYVDDAGTGQRLVPGSGYVTQTSGSTSATAPGASLTGTATFTGGAATGGGGGAATAPGANLTGTATFAGGAATGGGGVVTFTTLPFKLNNTTVRANAALTLNLYHPTTGALVLQKTGLTTNGAGVASFTDAALVSGVSYAYEPVFAAADRRLPVKAAT